MAAMLLERQKQTGDPRGTGARVIWDTSPYYGGRNPQAREAAK
jgi:hypothetical protein